MLLEYMKFSADASQELKQRVSRCRAAQEEHADYFGEKLNLAQYPDRCLTSPACSRSCLDMSHLLPGSCTAPLTHFGVSGGPPKITGPLESTYHRETGPKLNLSRSLGFCMNPSCS
ncbi:uncharacterized protein J5F26_010934 isoform 2-T3 [Ciconia maguari]